MNPTNQRRLLEQQLDQQISHLTSKEAKRPSFGDLEDKLASIESKLRSLQKDSVPVMVTPPPKPRKHSKQLQYDQATSHITYSQTEPATVMVAAPVYKGSSAKKETVERGVGPKSKISAGMQYSQQDRQQSSRRSTQTYSSPSSRVVLSKKSIGLQKSSAVQSKRSMALQQSVDRQDAKETAGGAAVKRSGQVQSTPYKKLGLVSNTVGDNHSYHRREEKQKDQWTNTKSQKSVRSTAKKYNSATKISSNTLKAPRSSSGKKTGLSSGKKTKKSNSQRQLGRPVSSWQLEGMRREVDHAWRQNVHLRKRVSELRGYENEYWRMRQMFAKCQRLRRQGK